MNASDPIASEEARRVLLVEDTLEEALQIRTLLEAQVGCKVSLAQDGIRGCQLAENQEWDLVITDLNLPGRDGMEVIGTSSEAHPGTPVLATTAYTGDHYVDQALRQGADEVLTKPLDRDEFLAKVTALMKSGRRERRGASPDRRHERSVLAFSALPGDSVLGCGGILYGHLEHGHRVGVLVFSAGGGEDGDPEERKAEAVEAAEAIGAELILAEPFGSAIPGVQQMMAEAEAAVERFEPDTVYTPSPSDVRESRLHAHQAALVAASEVRSHYCYQAATTTLEFRPTLFIDVGEYMTRKLDALAAFQAKPDFRPHLQPHIGRASAQYWGRFLGYQEVEPLEVIQSEG